MFPGFDELSERDQQAIIARRQAWREFRAELPSRINEFVLRNAVLLTGFAVLGVAMLLLSGCEPEVDRGACLHYTQDLIMIPIAQPNGGITMIPTFHDRCNKWQFPDGRPNESNRTQ